MTKLWNAFLKRWILPRGLQYRHNHQLYNDWQSYPMLSEKDQPVIYYIPDKIDYEYVVILCHPYLAQASQFFLESGHTTLYKSLGIGVVLFDFNGFGRSPSYSFEFEKDINNAVTSTKNLFPNSKIILHGISFGGSNIINYGITNRISISKVIIENTLDINLSYFKTRNTKLYHFFKILMVCLPGFNKKHVYFERIKDIQLIENILFIYNEEDTLATIEMGRKLHNNCPLESTFCITKGAHLEAINRDSKHYESTLKNFLS